MGLDTTVYGGPYELLKKCDDGDEGEPTDAVHVYVNEDFPGRQDDLVHGFYTAECLERGPSASYGGHRVFRGQLTQCFHGMSFDDYGARAREKQQASADIPEPPGPSFHEFIWFSDCEGVLGPETGAKLAKDFEDHEATFLEWSRKNPGWPGHYMAWKRALRQAADAKGFITFH